MALFLLPFIFPSMFHFLAWTVPQTLTCASVSIITVSRQLFTTNYVLKLFLSRMLDDNLGLTDLLEALILNKLMLYTPFQHDYRRPERILGLAVSMPENENS